jgi:phage/plasmid primase-like uncharacterized protein
MSYMTMEEQIASHLTFLRQNSFIVDELCVDGGFIRCFAAGNTIGRGEICYQTKKNQLRNGLVGLVTWAREEGGESKIHKTYGQDFLVSKTGAELNKIESKNNSAEIERAEAFWRFSNEIGEAEYLLKKGVGYYGIRFRDAEYGKVAIVPMRDISEKLWSYQVINPDGAKRYAKEIETKSLLHMLHKPIDGFPIGLAESYVTAATCFELTGMAMVTAFSADNLKPVGLTLKAKFRNSPIIVFGDNDRHLQENKGKLAAEAVKDALGTICKIVLPEFNGYPPQKEFSDWNDLVREIGIRETRKIIASLSIV